MKNKAKLFALVPIIFFSVSGGPYGLEEIVSSVGPIPTLLLILILPIIWTIPECMIVAELSSTYPVQGGYYKWVQMGMGKFWGFMEGWWSILYTLVDLALYPILFTTYLKILIPQLDFWFVYLIQLFMIWSCALINIVGIRLLGYFLVVFKIFILICFIAFIIMGLNYISFDFSNILLLPKKIDSHNILFGLSLAFWNFIGWDNGSTVLGEVENPHNNYHKALFITIPIVVFFYFFPILVGVSIHSDWQNWRFGEFSFIANSMKLPFLGAILAVGGMVSCLGLFNSLLLSSTRVFSTMAEDRMFPHFFSLTHRYFNTPYLAIIFLAFVYSVLVLFDFENLIIYDVFLYLIAMLLEAISLIILRRKNPSKKSLFRIPFGDLGMYLIVGVAILVILFMAYINIFNMNHSYFSSFLAIFFIFTGIPVYLYFNHKTKRA